MSIQIEALNNGAKLTIINKFGQVERVEFFDNYADAYKAQCLAEAVWRSLMDGTIKV